MKSHLIMALLVSSVAAPAFADIGVREALSIVKKTEAAAAANAKRKALSDYRSCVDQNISAAESVPAASDDGVEESNCGSPNAPKSPDTYLSRVNENKTSFTIYMEYSSGAPVEENDGNTYLTYFDVYQVSKVTGSAKLLPVQTNFYCEHTLYERLNHNVEGEETWTEPQDFDNNRSISAPAVPGNECLNMNAKLGRFPFDPTKTIRGLESASDATKRELAVLGREVFIATNEKNRQQALRDQAERAKEDRATAIREAADQKKRIEQDFLQNKKIAIEGVSCTEPRYSNTYGTGADPRSPFINGQYSSQDQIGSAREYGFSRNGGDGLWANSVSYCRKTANDAMRTEIISCQVVADVKKVLETINFQKNWYTQLCVNKMSAWQALKAHTSLTSPTAICAAKVAPSFARKDRSPGELVRVYLATRPGSPVTTEGLPFMSDESAYHELLESSDNGYPNLISINTRNCRILR